MDETATSEWLTHTPVMLYYLEAWSSRGEYADQKIYMTEEEYDALKQHLAKLRGLLPSSDSPPAA